MGSRCYRTLHLVEYSVCAAIMINRPFWQQRIERVWHEVPILWLCGVRRCGKTTLAESLGVERLRYINCDLPTVEDMVRDPQVFFRECSQPVVVFDEIHQLRALEITHAVTLVRPFHGGGQHELVKQPKVYAFDTGFVSFARGWDPLRQDDFGILWEHLVLEQLQAHFPDTPCSIGAIRADTRSTLSSHTSARPWM